MGSNRNNHRSLPSPKPFKRAMPGNVLWISVASTSEGNQEHRSESFPGTDSRSHNPIAIPSSQAFPQNQSLLAARLGVPKTQNHRSQAISKKRRAHRNQKDHRKKAPTHGGDTPTAKEQITTAKRYHWRRWHTHRRQRDHRRQKTAANLADTPPTEGSPQTKQLGGIGTPIATQEITTDDAEQNIEAARIGANGKTGKTAHPTSVRPRWVSRAAKLYTEAARTTTAANPEEPSSEGRTARLCKQTVSKRRLRTFVQCRRPFGSTQALRKRRCVQFPATRRCPKVPILGNPLCLDYLCCDRSGQLNCFLCSR